LGRNSELPASRSEGAGRRLALKDKDAGGEAALGAEDIEALVGCKEADPQASGAGTS
jgi:hypothetical protein